MGGAAKKVAKPFKKIGKALGSIVKGSIEASVKPLKGIAKSLAPNIDIPEQGDPPLIPDYEMIEKDRRRRRSRKMGRVETIMTDTLG